LLAVSLTLASAPALAQSADDAFDALPRQERDGEQVGWFVNDTMGAMIRAVETGRPLVIVLGQGDSGHTRDFAQKVAPCPHINQLAGVVVFAYASYQVDEFARRMAVHLKIEHAPSIAILAPRTDVLTELHRIEGVFDAATVAGDIRRVAEAGGYWPDGRHRPATLPNHYLAYPNLGCTPEGARRLGLMDGN
jgi:hypothetical protein